MPQIRFGLVLPKKNHGYAPVYLGLTISLLQLFYFLTRDIYLVFLPFRVFSFGYLPQSKPRGSILGSKSL